MSSNPFDLDFQEPEPTETDVFGLKPIVSAPNPKREGVVIHRDVEQNSIQWFELRRGLLTSSEMKLIVTVSGGGTATEYRATGAIPEKLTPARSRVLDSIGARTGTVAEIAFASDVSDGVVRDLIKAGAIEAVKVDVPLSYKYAVDDKEKTHLYELLAQRVTGYVEPHFQSYDMERGNFDEEHARAKYSETYGKVEEVGFVTNDKLGFRIGCSPDGLVGDDGGIEAKSRIQKYQMQTLIEHVAKKEIPPDFLIQVQSSLFIVEREWWDFVSYSGGMMMASVRCYPDPVVHEAIGNAAVNFEQRLAEKLEIYENLIASDARLVPTERLMYL